MSSETGSPPRGARYPLPVLAMLIGPLVADYGRHVGLQPLERGLVVGLSVGVLSVIVHLLQTRLRRKAPSTGQFSAWAVIVFAVVTAVLVALVANIVPWMPWNRGR